MSNERKRREALVYHSKPKPGKIKVIPSGSSTVISLSADKNFIKLSYIEKISLKYMF